MLHVLAAHPGHVGEVAGHQREHARRGERHEPGQDRHGQGDQDVPVDHDQLRPLGPGHRSGHPLDQVGEQGGLLLGFPPGSASPTLATTRPSASTTSV